VLTNRAFESVIGAHRERDRRRFTPRQIATARQNPVLLVIAIGLRLPKNL